MATISDAIALFDQQRYREAFVAFAEIYNQSQDSQERKNVFHMLEEAFYAPNVDELRECYERNLALLKDYPFFWNKTFRMFEEMSFQFFPVSDTIFCCYDKKKGRFCGEYDAKTDQRMRYFFEHLDQPVQVKDEDNFYNLTFLNDNVRASEDFAGDNHIYLLYTSLEPLERLMMSCDLEPVLRQQKFVFLIGEENWSKYPINFRKKFGIDYAKMKPTPIRIEEVKRICFWYKHAYSGTALGLAVLGAADGIQAYSGHDFHTYSTVDGKPLYFTAGFRDSISDIDRTFTVAQIEEMARSGRYELRLEHLPEYLEWLRHGRAAPHEYSVKELFCGYFLFLYEKRGLNPRIVPTLFYDPHMWDPSPYNALVLSFPYHTVLTCVREPMVVFARCNMIGIVGWDEFSTKYILASDYVSAQFLHPDLLDQYFGYRFEDLKTRPETVCRAVCKHLNILFDSKMLKAEAPMRDSRTGQVTKGFDNAPLHRDISAVLSEFDQIRLKMFYEPIHKYYGYPTFSFEEHPLSEETVRELFQVPFRFEYINHKMLQNAPPPETLHKWIQEMLQNAWRKKITPPKLISLEEATVE